MFGIGGKRAQPSPPARADALADVVLQDSTGAEVRLGDLWADRPVVLVFLRHYG
jgi:hypothetical protein